MLRFLLNYFYAFLYNFLFPVKRKGEALEITYYWAGRRRRFFLPTRVEPGVRTYLIKEGKKEEITQEGGVPLLVCAEDLGGEELVCESLEGDKTCFIKQEIPFIVQA